MRLIWLLIFAVISPILSATPYLTQTWKTGSGVEVVLYQAMDLPILDISLAFAAGSAYDDKLPGLSALTAALINQGNAGLSDNTIAENLEAVGAQFSADNNRDMTILSLRTLTSEIALPEAMRTFGAIISHPDFPLEAFSREKRQQLQVIEQSQQSPDTVANQAFFATLYKNHPYAHSVNGTKAGMEKISLADIKQFYQRYYVAKNAVLVMVGAIDSKLAHQLAEQLTHDLAAGEPAPSVPKAAPVAHATTVNIPFPATQTMLRLGQLGIDFQSPDFFPLLVGNYILGGGTLVSRLGMEVREKQGLTYGVASQFSLLAGGGPFVISLSTKTKQATRALNLTKDILTAFVQKGVEDAELRAAKQYLVGNFPLSLASNRAIAAILLRIAFYHLPPDYLKTYVNNVNAVTKESIQQAFRKHIDLNRLITVSVGQM